MLILSSSHGFSCHKQVFPVLVKLIVLQRSRSELLFLGMFPCEINLYAAQSSPDNENLIDKYFSLLRCHFSPSSPLSPNDSVIANNAQPSGDIA